MAVIENEFGEIGIDQELVETKETVQGEEVLLLNNGCICCTVRQDLVNMLDHLVPDEVAAPPRALSASAPEARGFATKRSASKGKIDHIVIETTGLANPMPIIGTFFMEPAIREKVRLEGIVTMVDAKHVMRHLDHKDEESKTTEVVDQIA